MCVCMYVHKVFLLQIEHVRFTCHSIANNDNPFLVYDWWLYTFPHINPAT